MGQIIPIFMLRMTRGDSHTCVRGFWLNPFPTKDVYTRPMFCHATTEDVYYAHVLK